LRNTQVSDVSFLKELKGLSNADLVKNQIKEIPAWIVTHPLEIRIDEEYASDCINLFENPIEIPPIEIVKQGKEAIRIYYEQMEQQGSEKLYEAKVIILGEAGSGKTTLFKKLQEPSLLLPDTVSTLGVEVKEGHVFDHPVEKECKITANLWDFGGQEIQYQLHQYFITPDSLYILVADNRKQHTRWDYWFQIISLFGGECPVLVVLNNNRTYSSEPNFPIDKCKSNFSKVCIDSTKTDFSRNDGDWLVLQQKIQNELSALPLVNKAVPKLWKPLREALAKEKEKTNYIDIKRFFELCPKGLDTEEHRLSALEYFHRIGIVLHFDNDKNLRDIVFLNPNWITQALYAALNGANKDLAQGMFSENWIFKFWEEHPNHYDYNERTYLLRLMLKDNFDICYEIGTRQYIVPMLLPNHQPDYQWDYSDNLGFRIQYPFMPEGIISRFMVRMNEMIDNSLIWLEGVVLKSPELKCRAQVFQKKDFKSGLMFIDIHISGASLNNRKELLLSIREQIYHIHKTSFAKIPFTELVVCNCEKCVTLTDPHYYSLDELKDYLAEHKQKIECRRLKDRVSINQLLGTVYSDNEIQNLMEHGMKKSESLKPANEPKINPVEEKRSNTITALFALAVIFGLAVGTIVLFNTLGISAWWFLAMIIFVILLVASVWSYAVSPSTVSEKGAISMFDKVLRRLDILSLITGTRDSKKSEGNRMNDKEK